MNIIIAPNSFKECASSTHIAGLIARALQKRGLADLTIYPVSDGGDGFLDVCTRQFGLELIPLSIHNCFNGRRKKIKIGYDKNTYKVYIESASVIGLNDVPPRYRKPMKMNSGVLGELLQIVMKGNDSGSLPVEKIIIGIGGTATNDLGLGLCSIFGLKILDDCGNSLPVYPENFIKAESIVLPKKSNVKIEVILDVSVPLTGADGPARLFSRQKGASDKEARILEEGTKNVLRILKQHYALVYSGKNLGAGGGLGLGLSLLSKMRIVQSADFLKRTMKLSSVIGAADIVITGEGRYDRQSNLDKAARVVLKEASRQKKKIFLIAGRIECKDKLPRNVVPIQMGGYFSSTTESIRKYRKGIDLAVDEILNKLGL